jgi:putative tricarboxylic transport membrane protein
MALRGGHALTIAAVSSFVAGVLGVAMMAGFSPALARAALRFGPAEYAAVVILGFATLPAFAAEGRIKLLVSLGLGLMLATIGVDPSSAQARFTFGTTQLLSGIPFVAAIIGLFGIGDIFYLAGSKQGPAGRPEAPRFHQLFPSIAEWLRIRWSILRGSVVGFLIGVLPGAGATIASFTAYAVEQQCVRDKSGFGKGRPEGLAGAEAGNSGASIGTMVPLLTLGIPGSPSTAIMFGGFLIWGLQPGPSLFLDRPEFVWGLIASMLIGNMALLVMCVTMVPLFAQLLRVPFTVLAPLVIVFCAMGTYSVNSSIVDVWIMFAFGALGYVMRLAHVPVPPLVLGLVLEPILEGKLRQALTISGGDVSVFVTRPISATLLACALVIFTGPPLYRVCRRALGTRTALGHP